MSSKRSFLALRLEGPMQSWGFDSQYNRRHTGLMPTKSGIAGMCCAALGIPRGSEREGVFLVSFDKLRMTAIAIPRNRAGRELPVRMLEDFHTVQNTRQANGKIKKDCVLTTRQYMTDVAFGVLLEGEDSLLGDIAGALADPKWGIWLGRKTCIPSAPVLAGMKSSFEEALVLLIGNKPLKFFTRQEEASAFAQGGASIPDRAISFERRSFAPRRVVTIYRATP